MTTGRVIAIALLLLPLSPETDAIIIRHDRDDARHVVPEGEWKAVGGLVPLGDGVVTLIDPHWAITAAHVAANISPFVRAVRFGPRDHRIERVFFHPTWTGEESLRTVDMALIRFAEPVQGIEPVPLYRSGDESGRIATFVGWGDHGDGLTGPRDNDGRRRAATNEVIGVLDGWIKFLFDVPPDGTEMEGISGPGDSGGPALIMVEGRAHIAGISAFNDDMGTGVGECEYGSTEFYARVSTSVEWIEKTLKNPQDGGRTWDDPIDLRDGWPATSAARVARSFYRAYGRGSEAALEKWARKHRTAEALESRSAAARARDWTERRERWGELRPIRAVPSGDRDLHVLTKLEGENAWFDIRFVLREGKGRKLDFISLGADLPPRDD